MAVRPVPEGYHSVVPYITVPDVSQALEFVQRAFDAKQVEAAPDANGVIRHADVLIGDSHVMFGQASERWPSRPGTLYLYTENVDELYRKAMAAGGRSLREPTDEFYGDRSAGVEDAQGNQWWMATHVEDVPPEEMERRMKEAWT
jgi:PhnB protein